MIAEPIIDIIVYGYPKYLPISISNYIYTKTDALGNVRYFIKEAYTEIAPYTSNQSNIKLLQKNILSRVMTNTDIKLNTKINGQSETYISLLDTRDYYDWMFNESETWNDLENVTNNDWIRRAGNTCGIKLTSNETSIVRPLLELNCHIGVLFTWENNQNETWEDHPNVTNEEWIKNDI